MSRREEIVEKMKQIVGAENVVTDREVLEDATHDRFRKYEGYHKVFTNPLPAAVVFVNNAEEVSGILRYCNAKKLTLCQEQDILLQKADWRQS